jgi:hypothetical protein
MKSRDAPSSREQRPIPLHPSWIELIELCRTMGYGEIERLKIQDGLPVFLEKVTEKIKLA